MDEYVPVRLLYTDLSSELIKIPLKQVEDALHGLAKQLPVSVGGKDVMELHIINALNHRNFIKVEAFPKKGYNLTILPQTGN